MQKQTWMRGMVISIIALISLVVVGLAVSSGDSGSAKAVQFGTPENPFAGSQGNTNPVFDTVQNWRDLVKTVENQKADWYKQCLQSRIGVTWDQAQAYAKLVDQGHDLRLILVSNSSVTDAQARQVLKDQGVPNVDSLPIKRLNGFQNTQGLPQDKCNAFGDSRSQVRVSLAIPVDVNDLSKGIHDDKGVLGMCSNPWNISKEFPPGPTPPTSPPGPPPTSPPPTVPPTTPPTTVPPCLSGKCTPPVTQPAPQVTEPPPTTAPPANGGQGDSGDGATNTTTPPTTVAPAPAPPVTSPPVTAPPGPPAP